MTDNTFIKDLINISLADDDEDDQNLFRDAIHEAGLNAALKIFNNGVDLTSFLMDPQSIKPDILFLDINMPQKNGLQCLQEIRRNSNLKSLPIVIYSTSSYPPNIQETFDKGANLYFMKPNSFLKLVKNLEEIVSLNWYDYILNRNFDRYIFS